MTGRSLAWLGTSALLAILVWHAGRGSDRLEASRLLARVEAVTLAAMATNRFSARLAAGHLLLLDRAEVLDPREVGIPMARGTQHLLLGRPRPAIAAYEDALRLEERPETHLNLGRAHLMAGHRDLARSHIERALLLDPRLSFEVPTELRDAVVPR